MTEQIGNQDSVENKKQTHPEKGICQQAIEKIEDLCDSVGDKIDEKIGLQPFWNKMVGMFGPVTKHRWTLRTRKERRADERRYKNNV